MPRFPSLRSGPSRTTRHAEAYRILRSNLDISLLDLDRPSVLVSSARAGEGKTSTAVNLARSLAIAGRRVVLVDLDLRHPDAHQWLGARNDPGVTDVLSRRRTLGESLQFIPLDDSGGGSGEGLYFLSTGLPVPNPTELLSGARTQALLDTLANQADVVVIDAPPVLPVADAMVIGRVVGGVVLVVETRKTPVSAVQQAKDALTRSQARLLGVVVNKLQPRDARSDHGYGYGYDDDYPHMDTTRRRRPREPRGQTTERISPVWPADTVSTGRTKGAPTVVEEGGFTNGDSPDHGIDLPWPTATGPAGIAGALPPPPPAPARAVVGSDEGDRDHSLVAPDAGAAISGNGVFDRNGLVEEARTRRRFGRRR